MTSTFAYGTSITLPDNKNDGGRTPTTQTLVASEWNAVADAATSLRQRAQSVIWDARDYGVPQDGTSDCTASIQAMLDAAFNYLNEGGLNCVTLFFPANEYNISSTLVVRGTSSTSPAILGQPGVGRGFFQGTVFKWTGADNALMMHTEAFNGGLMEDLYFWANDKAGRCLQLAATTWASGDTAPVSASGQTLRRCTFTSVKPGVSGNGCLALGSDPVMGSEYQSDTFLIDTCNFNGESNGAPGFSWSGLAAFGIKTLSAGNCKEFLIINPNVDVCATGFDFQHQSGSCVIIRPELGDVATLFKSGSGTMHVIGGDAECGDIPNGNFKVLVGTGQWGCATTIEGMQAFGNATADDNVILTYGGSLVLRQNIFGVSNSSGGAPHTFKMVVSGAAPDSSVQGSFISEQMTYENMPGPYPPLYDGSGNPYFPTALGDFNDLNPALIRSWGDNGGTGGSPVVFKNYDMSATRFASINVGASDASGSPGAATINLASGTVAIQSGHASVVVTNSLVSSTSRIFVTLEGNADATLTSLPRITKTSGSFTIFGNANATGNPKVSFFVLP